MRIGCSLRRAWDLPGMSRETAEHRFALLMLLDMFPFQATFANGIRGQDHGVHASLYPVPLEGWKIPIATFLVATYFPSSSIRMHPSRHMDGFTASHTTFHPPIASRGTSAFNDSFRQRGWYRRHTWEAISRSEEHTSE